MVTSGYGFAVKSKTVPDNVEFCAKAAGASNTAMGPAISASKIAFLIAFIRFMIFTASWQRRSAGITRAGYYRVLIRL
jgi:hypothetical protein